MGKREKGRHSDGEKFRVRDKGQRYKESMMERAKRRLVEGER